MEGRTKIEQGTEEWKASRRGNITSSQVYRLMAEHKLKADKEAGNLSEGAKTYIMELIAEEIATPAPEFENDATRWGHDNEPIAKYHYQRQTGIIIKTPSFIPCEEIPGYGGSPDGITEEQSAAIFGELDRAEMAYGPGCQEIKCPFSTAIHLDYCLIKSDDDMPTAYYWQCQSNIRVTNSMWCDFISFDPRLDYDCGLFIYRVKRNQPDIDRMEMKIKKAIEFKLSVKEKLNLI